MNLTIFKKARCKLGVNSTAIFSCRPPIRQFVENTRASLKQPNQASERSNQALRASRSLTRWDGYALHMRAPRYFVASFT